MGIACPEEPSSRFSRSSEREAALEIGLSPLQGQATFDETLRECEQAEAAGLSSIWLGEHHNHPLLVGKPESHVAVLRYVFVAGSNREAISAAGDSFVGAFERMYFQWPHPIAKRPPGRLTIERLAENRIVLGDPKACVEEIIRFQRELGANHFICRFSVPGIPRDLCAQSLSLFTREVMPALLS